MRKITYDFVDTEGRWTSAKRKHAAAVIVERCNIVGYVGEIAIAFPPPIASPGVTETVFHFHADAEIPY
jgi:hypothetical protein